MLNKLALIHGEPVIPDGWACIYGERFDKSEPVLTFSRILENDFYYHIREIRAKWDQARGDLPVIEIFRDLGNRAYQQGNLGVNGTDLHNLTSPAESIAGDPISLKPAVPLNIWFPPSSRLYVKITGHVSGGNLDLVVHGRYYLKPEAVI